MKIGRTHLMDAVPMTMGQAFDAFRQQIAFGIERIEATFPRLCLLPQGGTAVGTGLNAPAGFDAVFCEEVSTLSGVAFKPNPSKFEGMGAHDAFVEVSGALNVVAVSLTKMANDIRLLASGPRCGLGELILPHDGLTSSIMPGKRNPTIAEVVVQAAFAVMGNHATISMAGAAGTFELNVAKPVIIDRTPAIDPDLGRQCSGVRVTPRPGPGHQPRTPGCERGECPPASNGAQSGAGL